MTRSSRWPAASRESRPQTAPLPFTLLPTRSLAALSLEFDDDLRTPEIEKTVQSVKRRVRARHPEVVTLFVKPQTLQTFDRTLES